MSRWGEHPPAHRTKKCALALLPKGCTHCRHLWRVCGSVRRCWRCGSGYAGVVNRDRIMVVYGVREWNNRFAPKGGRG